MKTRRFSQVDVFTDTPYLGNPLAVVHDASGLDAAAMQRFTDWTNLSEASFLSPPTHADADYAVRIFCPGRELPFAGHPTLGSCHAWLEAGGRPKGEFVVQECGIGLVRIRRDARSGALAFAAPPLVRGGPLDDADLDTIARGLRIARSDIVAHAWCDNGPRWRGVMLASAQQVLALKPDAALLSGWELGIVGPRAKLGVVGPRTHGVASPRTHGVVGPRTLGVAAANQASLASVSREPVSQATVSREPLSQEPEEAAFEVRAFFPGHGGLAEDPVTGSLNAAMAQWLICAGIAPARYVAAQGTALGRAGRVHVEQVGKDIWIGGHSVTCVRGEVVV
jgi:predicted PhzF superfamily epimerase YddE/YHI9